MSSPAAKPVFTPSMIEPARAGEHYPRALVMWGTLTFCLSAWALVIVAVTRLV